jgi:hypothetical protein
LNKRRTSPAWSLYFGFSLVSISLSGSRAMNGMETICGSEGSSSSVRCKQKALMRQSVKLPEHKAGNSFQFLESRGGRVCLDSLKQFLSDKLLCLMPLPPFEVVYSSKHHPVSAGQDFDACAAGYRTQNIPRAPAGLQQLMHRP